MCSQAQRKLRLDWSSLPADAIEAISTRIADDPDYVRFRSVCSSWRSATPKRPRIPCLLVVHYDADPISLGLCSFPNSNFFPAPRLRDGIIQGKALCGSSRGWIALLDDSPAISLHNLFTAVHINLPSLANLPWMQGFTYRECVFCFNNFPYFLAKKLVLSSDPRIQSCIALTFSHNCERLIYCRPGDASWTPLPLTDHTDMLDDILFYRGKFYVVRAYKVFVCDIRPDNAHVTQILPMDPLFSDGNPREGYSYNKTSYLVYSSGDLLLVSVRHPHMECDDPDCDDCHKFSFEVFRVDLDFGETPDGRLSLFKLDTLGGRSLFLGCNSMSISAGDSPSCKGNSIYFISKYEIDMFGVFVFSMEDNTVSSVTGLSENRASKYSLNWLTPSLC